MSAETAPVLLAIETATDRCGVALMRGDRLLVAHTIGMPRSHAEWLTTMLDDALRYAHLAPGALDAVAVSMGPGSYTGLRIGVSAAKGLCFATGAALLGVPTLEAVALGVLPFARPGDTIAVALNSRREEVYLALFEASLSGLTPRLGPSALSLEDAVTAISEAPSPVVWVVGEGAGMLQRHGTARDAAMRFLPEVGPSPAGVAMAGLERFRQGATESLADFEPYYLKDFIPREKSGTAFDRLPPGRD
ncbi:MAG: tRNA (adenosine(37)-N6)-threonylcarbamoyltransferase complex dimerization subunit type 1 TsaB [Rhodothermales bacterium]|nr:tRNA (adenosine(37)-N6)-threonylcarbamoyltransferase complex dimerization subunit type 1 TsaB [Rhodothermales bacterium]